MKKCDKKFQRKENLDYHTSHDACRERKFGCEHCDNRFTTSANMYRHMKHSCKTKKKIDVYAKLESLEEEIKKLSSGKKSQSKTAEKQPTKKRCAKKTVKDGENELQEDVEHKAAKEENPDINVDDVSEEFEHVYLVRTIFEKNDEGKYIYKYGKTTRLHNRFNSYPVGTIVYLVKRVYNCHYVEGEIKRLFNKYFVHEEKHGYEYFSGNVDKMIECINKIIKKTGQLAPDETIIPRLKVYYRNRISIKIEKEIEADQDVKIKANETHIDNNTPICDEL